MKKSLTYLTIFVSVFFLWLSAAEAHSYGTNGAISALLHAEPGDQPVARQKGSLYFFLTDKENKFQPSKCDCRLVVKYGTLTILDHPLFSNLADQQNGVNAQIPITFPKKGVYDVSLTGTPKTADAFAPFAFSYKEKVDRDSPNVAFISAALGVPAMGLAGGVLARRSLKLRRAKKTNAV